MKYILKSVLFLLIWIIITNSCIIKDAYGCKAYLNKHSDNRLLNYEDFIRSKNNFQVYNNNFKKILNILRSDIDSKENRGDCDVDFLHNLIIYNKSLYSLCNNMMEYKSEKDIDKLCKRVIKLTDDILVPSIALAEVLEEIPIKDLEKEDIYIENTYAFCNDKLKEYTITNEEKSAEKDFLKLIYIHNECIIKMCTEINKLSSRKEVKDIAEKCLEECLKSEREISQILERWH